ncbi:MAG: universal stress protein [Phycisphaerales bacterium]|nr:universal stress protein [Phycisphaerales bacterium]
MPDSRLRPIRRILVGTGLTVESVGAVLLAHWLSDQLSAELHAVHAISPISPAAEQAIPGLANTHIAQAEEELEKFVAAHNIRDFAQLHVIKGRPAVEIIRLGMKIDADLLVIGRYGRGGLKRGILGAVAERVVRKNPTSVLVVQPEFRGPIQKVGVASACEDNLNLELERGLELASRFGMPTITMIKAYEVPTGYHMVSTYEQASAKLAEVHAKIAQEQVRLASARLGNPPAVEVQTRLGRPIDVLPKFAEDAGLDLLVIGTHSRTQPAELLLDNISEAIVRRANCNIWAEKSPAETQTLRGFFRALLD